MPILESIGLTEKVASLVCGIQFQTCQGQAFPLNQLVDDVSVVDDERNTNAQDFRTLRELEIFLEQIWKLLNMRLDGYEQECKSWETEFTCQWF